MILNSITKIIEASRSEGSTVPHWFNESSMSFFNTRCLNEVFPMGRHGVLFMTADRTETNAPEGFTLRWAFVKEGFFYISTLGGLMAYESEEDVRNGMYIMGNSLCDIVREVIS